MCTITLQSLTLLYELYTNLGFGFFERDNQKKFYYFTNLFKEKH